MSADKDAPDRVGLPETANDNGAAANATTGSPLDLDQPQGGTEAEARAQTERLQKLAREAIPERPKKFYTSATIEPVDASDGAGGFAVRLDGRPVKTPARRALVLPTETLAAAVAGEWDAQVDVIDPQLMPLTRLANTTLDGVTANAARVRDEVVQYAASDLVCYRADSPSGLVAQQIARWDPILTWAAERHGAVFAKADGIMPVTQSDAALEAVRAAVADVPPFPLAGLHVVMTLSGSALLALALRDGAVDADGAWGAAHVDEDWQISQWGEDAEAAARRAARRREFDAAVFTMANAEG
ncbi:MAG: ATP12 family protein [Pseudomonadota bacterium]